MMSSKTSSLGSGHSLFSFFCIFLQKLKEWHMCKKIIRRVHSMPVPLTSSSICCSYHDGTRAGIIFRNCEKSNDVNQPFFCNCRHAKRNIPHSTVFSELEKCCARSKSERIIKTSKNCDLNFANSGMDTEAKSKTSLRHLNFLKQLNKTTEMCYL